MREAMHFTFDNIASEDMGVIIASPNGGLYQENFLPDRSIIETSVSKRNKPYFQRVESTPLSFSLTIFIEEWRERDNLRQIARWLYKDYYVPLTFESNPDRVFYAIVEGSSTLMHNGCKDGYVELNIRCNSPYTYSQVNLFNDVEVNGAGVYSILNSGDLPVKPKMRIKKLISDGSVSIEVEETGQTVVIDNLQVGEALFIDFENEIIKSDLEYLGVYHYSNHNDEWLELILGDNTLNLIGDFEFEIEYEMVYLAD